MRCRAPAGPGRSPPRGPCAPLEAAQRVPLTARLPAGLPPAPCGRAARAARRPSELSRVRVPASVPAKAVHCSTPGLARTGHRPEGAPGAMRGFRLARPAACVECGLPGGQARPPNVLTGSAGPPQPSGPCSPHGHETRELGAWSPLCRILCGPGPGWAAGSPRVLPKARPGMARGVPVAAPCSPGTAALAARGPAGASLESSTEGSGPPPHGAACC